MIIVFVEHFLNKEGQNIFPNWISNTEQLLQNYDGFISVKQLVDIQNKERSLLELRFSNMEFLKKWSASSEHNQAMMELTKYRVKKQFSQLLTYA